MSIIPTSFDLCWASAQRFSCAFSHLTSKESTKENEIQKFTSSFSFLINILLFLYNIYLEVERSF